MIGWFSFAMMAGWVLPFQVLGDAGILDLVKRHHLQSHLLVQYDVVGQDHFAEGPLSKDGWGQLVVAD